MYCVISPPLAPPIGRAPVQHYCILLTGKEINEVAASQQASEWCAP